MSEGTIQKAVVEFTKTYPTPGGPLYNVGEKVALSLEQAEEVVRLDAGKILRKVSETPNVRKPYQIGDKDAEKKAPGSPAKHKMVEQSPRRKRVGNDEVTDA